jgi:hypothetical protein
MGLKFIEREKGTHFWSEQQSFVARLGVNANDASQEVVEYAVRHPSKSVWLKFNTLQTKIMAYDTKEAVMGRFENLRNSKSQKSR